jgi:hypothetical protein
MNTLKLAILSAIGILAIFAGSAMAVVDSYMAGKVVEPPIIDGNLAEWAGVEAIVLGGDTWEAAGGTWDNDADLNMTLMIVWDNNALYVASVVKDEAHINTQTENKIWNGDCIQYMIDPTGNRTDTQDVVYEFGYALAGANSNEPMSNRWLQNAAAPATFQSEFAIVRNNAAGTTTYEVALPKAQIAPADLSAGKILGFGTIVNDGDPGAEGQKGWIGWGPNSIVHGKDATELKELVLGTEPAAVGPTVKLSTTWGNMKE